jgi:hypothetical protein
MSRFKKPRFSTTAHTKRSRKNAAPRARLPRLTNKIVADESVLAAAIDQVLLRDDNYRRLSRSIGRAQDRLQNAVTKDAFSRYLDIEEATNWRFTYALALIATWAFKQGQRRRRRSRRA